MKGRIIIILLVFAAACGRNYRTHNCAFNYTVSVSDNVDIDKGRIESAMASLLEYNIKSSYYFEIIVFGFSSGKEVFSYSGDSREEVFVDKKAGRLEALIKVRRNRELYDAVFVSVTGNTKEELAVNLAEEIRRALCD